MGTGCPSAGLAVKAVGLNGMPRGTVPGIAGAGIATGCGTAVAPIPAMPVVDGKVPVFGKAMGGISSTNGDFPEAPPMDAVRRLTACSRKSPSMRLPTPKARDGLPSTEINATPCPLLESALGDITPVNLKRVLNSEMGAATAVIATSFGVVPSNRVTSPEAAFESPTDTACVGTTDALTNNRKPQNMTLPATAAQTTNANKRGFISPL